MGKAFDHYSGVFQNVHKLLFVIAAYLAYLAYSFSKSTLRHGTFIRRKSTTNYKNIPSLKAEIGNAVLVLYWVSKGRLFEVFYKTGSLFFKI